MPDETNAASAAAETDNAASTVSTTEPVKKNSDTPTNGKRLEGSPRLHSPPQLLVATGV